MNLENGIVNIVTSSSGSSWISVHKRNENRSERRKLSAGEAVGMPALGKSAGDTRCQCPVVSCVSGDRNADGQKMRCRAGGMQIKAQCLSPANRRPPERRE